MLPQHKHFWLDFPPCFPPCSDDNFQITGGWDECEHVNPCSAACEHTPLGACACGVQAEWLSWHAWLSIPLPTVPGWLQGVASSPCHAPAWDRKPREQPEECCIRNLSPMHGLTLVSFEKQMLLGVA